MVHSTFSGENSSSVKIRYNIDVGRKTVELVFQRIRNLCSRANRDEKRKFGCRFNFFHISEFHRLNEFFLGSHFSREPVNRQVEILDQGSQDQD